MNDMRTKSHTQFILHCKHMIGEWVYLWISTFQTMADLIHKVQNSILQVLREHFNMNRYVRGLFYHRKCVYIYFVCTTYTVPPSIRNTTNSSSFRLLWDESLAVQCVCSSFVLFPVLFHLESHKHSMPFHEYGSTCFRFLPTFSSSTFNPIRLSFSSIPHLIQLPSNWLLYGIRNMLMHDHCGDVMNP